MTPGCLTPLNDLLTLHRVQLFVYTHVYVAVSISFVGVLMFLGSLVKAFKGACQGSMTHTGQSAINKQ